MSRETRWKLLIVAATLLVCQLLLSLRDRPREAAAPGTAPASPSAPLSAWPPVSPPLPAAPAPPRVESAGVPSPVLDEAAVHALLPHLAQALWVRYDPVAMVRVVPDQSIRLDWKEHATGAMTLASNNLGFREDAPTLPHTESARVLVIGDSHTFGIVENDESFANLLERRLDTAGLPRRCEVLNAGTGGTGPYEHRALLGVLLDLSPELVLAVLYTGNDFINAMAFSDFETRRSRHPMSREAQQRFQAAQHVERTVGPPGRMAQCISQVHSFKHQAGDAEAGLAASIACYREMAQYCSERGARFLVAVLPTQEEVDGVDRGEPRSAADDLQLCEEDFELNQQLAMRFAGALAADGVQVVDLLPSLRGQGRPMYWKRDHHLNVDGHAAVAEALFTPVRALLFPGFDPGSPRARRPDAGVAWLLSPAGLALAATFLLGAGLLAAGTARWLRRSR